jgi:hypothetical protein
VVFEIGFETGFETGLVCCTGVSTEDIGVEIFGF